VRKTHLGAKELQNQRSHTKEINKHTTSRKQTSVSSSTSRTVPLARYAEKCWLSGVKLEPQTKKNKRLILWFFLTSANARLRGWQRTARLKKHTVNTELQFCTKVATRWQSLLSRLLCKFNKINWLYSIKSHDCNGWVIQESTQAGAVINKPPKQSPPFNNKPSFWIRQTQRAKTSASKKCSINLPFPHFAPARFTTRQR
jgi:hypothetical protein